jgi:hypothetical protein
MVSYLNITPFFGWLLRVQCLCSKLNFWILTLIQGQESNKDINLCDELKNDPHLWRRLTKLWLALDDINLEADTKAGVLLTHTFLIVFCCSFRSEPLQNPNWTHCELGRCPVHGSMNLPQPDPRLVRFRYYSLLGVLKTDSPHKLCLRP